MYIVKIINGDTETLIHNETQKLKSGTIVKGINSIDSFSFTLLPDNPGFKFINDFKTFVTVYNTNKKRYDFYGRVLYSNSSMDSDGYITKEVTCESYFGFLCDSQQPYVELKNWTVMGLVQHIIDTHNEQVEEYKRFKLGTVEITDPNDNVYIGIQRENTWQTIQEKLINKFGCEIRFRVESDGLYIDFLNEIGVHRTTEIRMSKNMKSITKEVDPSTFVSRLIPLGAKLMEEVDGEEVETEERLDITSVNDGKNYIDVADGISVYGIHVGYAYWDDVTVASTLLKKARDYLAENSRVQVKYSITALDLSLLGLDIDDFDVHNYHPIVNPLLGIDDEGRITRKTINITDEIQSNFEIGDNFKTLNEIIQDRYNTLKATIENIKLDTSNLQGKISVTQNSVNKLNTKIEGIDGTYLYIMYSPYADGHEMSNTPDENTMYMGTCSTSEEEAPTDYKLYTWVKVRGINGDSLQVKYLNSDTTPTITDNDVSGWKDTVPTPENGKKTYMTQKLTSETNWSTPIQISGEDGETPTFSISQNGYWIINGEETDAKAQGETPNITVGDNGNWFVDGTDTGTKAQGEQGKDGADIEYVYYRSQNAVSNLAAPSYSGTTLTSGWSASPKGITETYKYEYVSVRKKTAGSTTWGAFSTPIIWSKWGEKGTDGDGIEYKYYLSNSADKPTYSASNTKWTDDPKGVSESNMYEYVVQITHHGNGTADSISDVALWSKWGEQGIQGNPGASIDTITEYYARSSLSTSAPADSNFSTTVPTLTATYKYLWNYEVITYTGGKTATTTPKSVIGVFGADGKGIKSIAEYYLVSSSSSGITTSTTGWSTSIPQLTETNKYLWNYESITYTDNSTSTTTPIVIGVHGSTGKGISSVTNYYLASASSSGVTTSTTGWTAAVQTPTASAKHLWNYEKITYTDNSTANTAPCIIGVYSSDGKGISSVTEYYLATSSSSGVTTSTTGWSTTPQTTTTSAKYLWNYEKTTYTDNSTTNTTPVIIGVHGETGKGVSSVTNYYLTSNSSSGITTSTTGWSTTVQTPTSSAKYLWNYEKITYTDNSTANTTPCIIGNFAADGASINTITEYYAKSNSNQTAPTSWSTTVPTLDATNKYLWNYEYITYTGGKTATSTTPCVIGVFGADGKTQYWHIKYSDDGGTSFTGSNGEEIGMWIGTYVDFNETDSTDPSKYTWKKFEEVEKLTSVTSSNNTAIERTEEKIDLVASKTYVEKSAFEEYKEEVSSEFSVRAEDIDMKFTTTTKQIEDVDGDLQSKFEKVYKHISFNNNGITIGSGDSAIELVIDNTNGIVFKKNGVQFGWWDGTDFHTGNIVVSVTERAQFGDYAFVPRSDGSLSFLKVGGTGAAEGDLSGGSDE